MYLRHGDLSWEPGDGNDAATSTTVALASSPRSTTRRAQASRPVKRLPVVDLHGVRLHALSEAECISHILDQLDCGTGGVVITPNLDHLRRCVKDLNFGAMVAEADLVVPDGMPLVWASRLQGTPLPERVAGSNLISSLSAAASVRGRSIFLLGGAAGTADGAAAILQKRHPTLQIAGTLCPRVGFDENRKLTADIGQRLIQAKPDIVYIALGSPKQEHLIAKLRPLLPNTWWLGVGVSFSFLTGHVRRAPLWMQRSGFEWVHRLAQEPGRLFKRYIVSGLPFAASLMTRATIRGLPHWIGRGKPQEYVNAASSPPIIAAEQLQNPPDMDPALPTASSRPSRRPASTTPQNSLSRLKALVLLGGHVRPTPLTLSIGRSLLDLPLDDHGSVLNHWLKSAAELGAAAGLSKLPLRVMVDRNSPEPISADVKYYGTFRVERDQSEYRGTGGVLSDMAGSYQDDDLILVANAAQILLEPLTKLTERLDARGGDISVVSHRDGTPSGVMLVSVKTLRLIPKTGFVDMKEQAMPLIAQHHSIEVIHRRRPTGLPIRSATDYIEAMRVYHMRLSERATMNDPLAEDWQRAFGIVEDGAIVDPSARVHDSVVLRGAVVEAGAALVRSIVCPGGLVRRDRCVLDEFVRPVVNSRRDLKNTDQLQGRRGNAA